MSALKQPRRAILCAQTTTRELMICSQSVEESK